MLERPESIPLWPPTPGHYAMPIVKNGPLVPVRIWFGLPVLDGEEQDRAPGWQVQIGDRTDYWEKDDGQIYRCLVAIPISRCWPYCARRPITEAEWRFMLDHAAWAKENSPASPDADPRKAIDLNTSQPIY